MRNTPTQLDNVSGRTSYRQRPYSWEIAKIKHPFLSTVLKRIKTALKQILTKKPNKGEK
jgi:hypothetical protein